MKTCTVCKQTKTYADYYKSKREKDGFGPFAEDKQHHCQDYTDILIDDMPKNIEQWENQDGIGILHKSVDETLDALYDRCIAKEIGIFKDKQGVWRK